MKPSALMLFPLALLTGGLAMGQDTPPLDTPPPVTEPASNGNLPPATPPQDPGNGLVPTIGGAPPMIVEPNEATPPPAITPEPAIPSQPPVTSSPPIEAVPIPVPSIPPSLPESPAGQAPGANGTFAPLEQQKLQSQQASDGYIIKDANLNDIFQFLAKSAGKQYFHNVKISGSEYLVTGHLNDGNPQSQMEELAFQFGLSLHIKGNTIYALTPAQLSQLPSSEFHYQLKYLRPGDIDQIKGLVQPMLSPGTGIVNFEPKTNTVIIIDSATRIEQARTFLRSIDQAKGQVVIETKIFRVSSKAGQSTGVNWSGSLGKEGTSISVTQDLNSLFGLSTSATASNSLVLSPLQLSGVLKALADGNIANQVSNPTLITEDNEQASISIIDRIPIITFTSTQNGNTTQITEDVRYKIDKEDKSITEDPEKHREVGISLVVTPTVLSDGTVRMRLRPRSAQIVEYIKGQTGNLYPRVSESMIESITRVPDGHSLVVGGFYGEVQSKDKTKIPLLGDLPVINFFFKSKETSKEQSSLVFIVTPKSYDPRRSSENYSVSNQVRSTTILPRDHEWVDPYNPGPAHEPNLRRAIRSMQPEEAPYYPREEELTAPKPKKKSIPRIGRP